MLPAVRFIGEIDGDLWGWLVRSQTDLTVYYQVAINVKTGECSCDCMDFMCRRWKRRPDIFDGCKHIQLVRKESEELNELSEIHQAK